MDFTIVTASYNYGHYIGECLESVASQEGATFEHLVMDAVSKDDTAEVVARFPHAQFFQEPDQGMSDGINKGFRRAQGKWVMWLNADDRLKPGALKALKAFAEKNPRADVIYANWDFIDGDGHLLRLASLLMPKPDLIFSLEADADTILSRQNELTREEILAQTDRLHHLPLRGTRFVIIDAAQSPNQVVDDAVHALN